MKPKTLTAKSNKSRQNQIFNSRQNRKTHPKANNSLLNRILKSRQDQTPLRQNGITSRQNQNSHGTTNRPYHLSPPQRFKHSLYQSAVRSVPQAQSRMDRSGGEPLPDVRRFLVHPCRFLVHRWISRLWLHLTA